MRRKKVRETKKKKLATNEYGKKMFTEMANKIAQNIEILHKEKKMYKN